MLTIINHLTCDKFVLLHRQLRNISIQKRGNRIVFELLLFKLELILLTKWK